MKRLLLKTLIVIIIWGVAGSLTSPAQPGDKLSPELRRHVETDRPGAMISVIVQTHGASTAEEDGIVRAHGARKGHSFSAVRGFSAQIPVGRMEELARSPKVRRISTDWEARSLVDSAVPYIVAPLAWDVYGVRGSGVGVAVIDSGLTESSDLHADDGSRHVVHVDVLGGDPRVVESAGDNFGHGTHVAGIIGGSGQSSSGSDSMRSFKGVAYEADIISIRALNAEGMGNTSDILRAIDWVIANRDTYKIGVLNLSLGHPIEESYTTDPLCQAGPSTSMSSPSCRERRSSIWTSTGAPSCSRHRKASSTRGGPMRRCSGGGLPCWTDSTSRCFCLRLSGISRGTPGSRYSSAPRTTKSTPGRPMVTGCPTIHCSCRAG